MTPPSSPLPHGHRDQFDTGPLSWLMGEIREALNRSKAAIQESMAQDVDAQSTSLRHAKSYLHQAHGALQIVDVDGLSLITETVEDLLERVDAGQLAMSAELAEAIDSGYQALVEYLEELLSGVAHQPVRLFPYYRALLEARGAERIHPADMFFPDLALRPQFPPSAAGEAVPMARYVGLRQRFERSLLPFLKSTDSATELANAAIMRDLVGEIEGLQTNPQARAFWWVMHGLAEAVAADQIPNELYVKQLFARINLQIRRLCQGSSSITERLLRDALFFIAGIAEPRARARQICDVYQLDGLVPVDYARKRYGQVDVDALASAKERLVQAKNLWNRIANGDASVAESFEHEMRVLADAGSRLNSASLSKLLKELKGIARHAAHARPGDNLGLEMATSLLFVENALNQISRLSDSFSERADAMTARLLAVMAGEAPASGTPWLDDISREAQQRQTMAAVASEMQTSLRQVEKMLDEFFRDPSQRAQLDQLDTILYQIEGALAVLEQGDAVRTIRHTRAAVQRFLAQDSRSEPDQSGFQLVAQNVGALSFFIESLQLPSDQGKKRFVFDEQHGIFQANLIDKRTPEDPASKKALEATVDSVDFNPPSAASPSRFLPTVEDELAVHQRESAELVMSLTAEPGNHALQKQLKESLEQVRLDAALVDNPEATDRARAGIELLKRSDFSVSTDALAEIVNQTIPPLVFERHLPPVISPASDEAVDAELLEIFLTEAEEVLATVRQTLPESRSQPHNQEYLTILRRAFHTLKGSGRMVGLASLGEAAWHIEQVLNLRLSESRMGDLEMYALLDKAVDVLGAWVQDLQELGFSPRTPDALVAAAQAVKAGGRFVYVEPGASATLLGSPSKPTPLPDAIDLMQAGQDGAPLHDEQIPDDFEVGEDLSDLPQAEELQMSDADLALFNPSLGAHPVEPAEPEPVEAHLKAVPDPNPEPFAGAVIDFPTVPTHRVVDDNIKRIGELEISVPLHNIYLAETDDLVRMLAHDMAEWRHEPGRNVEVQSVHAAHSLAGSSATVGFDALHEVAHALEKVLQFLMRRPVTLADHEFDTLQQSVERLRLMLRKFALGEMPLHEPEHARMLTSLQRQIEARANQHAAAGLPEDGRPLSEQFGPGGAYEPQRDMDKRAVSLASPSPAQSLVEQVPALEPLYAPEQDASGGDSALTLKDELDADLLPVFVEEGRDMLPQMGQVLRNWQQEPASPHWPQSLLRLLHTLKGSARMAGAMNLGQHLHDMETRAGNLIRLGAPSNLAIEDLLARYDQGLHMFEGLQHPGVPPQTGAFDQAGGANSAPALQIAAAVAHGAGGARAMAAPAGPTPMVRVRADILDRLVNQAGEVSISRSRLETEVGTLRTSLTELTDNVGRLRDQLREIEMQAESQIASRMQHSADREFDPLEFDRFTRLQELTRMMAESVNDVGSVHQSLNRTLDSAADDLILQARLTRDLQQDLMRVRMVQFGSISERLFRVTRQASKEVDKRVNLDIRGSGVEIDRGVLERMTGPFEHLLRNAIVHGIEARDTRRAGGKNEIGELLVEVRQEGNEVVIQFTDDGQGLNLDRIRDKAQRLGLCEHDSEASDEEISDLIFHPGFSTAEEITELAGRGVGMDVVRSEATALGGRIASHSEPGKGAVFTIHLPLTLAVTQVVLLSTGGRIYAVPSVLVEQVQQLKTNPLTAAYNEGAVVWQGQRVPMYYLPRLLGDSAVSAVAQQYSPLIILKSGTDRVALHVDEIIGNREVVVKNIGPQLARMIGIAGATVLGSGEIVLILNPVPLALRAAQENLRAPRILPSDAPPNMGAVAELDGKAAATQGTAPVQGLLTQKIVMVVDDSLTVRRVTQRLLAREGYQVVLAKDGVDALEHLQSITPDVMLIDIEMPRMDGFDLTRNVRGDERTRHIPIIMITSRTAGKHRNYAIELGVNEYLGKPYQEERLVELIAGFIKSKEAAV
jgi:chemosensory pili system protein ChpA (sensor histidine kinase/response regulator)